MSDQQFEIGLHVATTSEDAKLSAVAGDLDKVNQKLAENVQASTKAAAGATKEKAAHEAAATAAGEHASKLSDLADKVVGYLAAWVGIQKITQWLKEGVEESINQERALEQLANLARAFGQDGGAAAEAARKLAESLQLMGIDDTQTLDTIATLLPLTRDYKEAINATTLVSEIAIARHMEYGQALSIVQTLIGGSARGLIMAHRMLGTQATTTQGALDELTAEMAKEASGIHDTQMEVDSMTAKWHDFWREIGDYVKPAFGWIASFLQTMTNGMKASELVIEDLRDKISNWVAFLLKIDLRHPVDSLKDAIAEYDTNEKRSLGESEVRWLKWGEAIEAAKNKAGEPVPGAGGHVTSHPIPPKEQDDKLPDAGKLPTDFLADRLNQEQNMWRLYYANVQAQRDKDLKNEEDTQKLLTKDLKTMHGQRLADYITELKKEEAALTDNGQRSFALNQRIGIAEKQMTDEVNRAKLEGTLATLQGVAGAAAEAFGQNKAVAIAEAGISTGVAAMHGFEMQPFFPVGLAMGALAIAKGIQQIRAIESTSIGGGGGAGGGGGSAAVYGSTSMSTQIPTIQNNSTTQQSNVRGGDTYNVSAITGSEAVAQTMKLQMALRPGSRAYDRQITSRKPVSAGTVRR